jgi:hypothetical protein
MIFAGRYGEYVQPGSCAMSARVAILISIRSGIVNAGRWKKLAKHTFAMFPGARSYGFILTYPRREPVRHDPS